jgi:hypothetical protein
MDTDELLTRWTVRVAVVFYVAALAARRFSFRWSRLTWTAGCVAYLLHVAAAFHYYHHWSHDVAYESTAQQTQEVVGFDWGGGLYFNYAFTLVWFIDAVWWCINPERYLTRPRVVEWAVQGFLGFIVFNATVVFATGFSRWLGVIACILLAIVWLWPRKERANVDANDQRRPGLDGRDDR